MAILKLAVGLVMVSGVVVLLFIGLGDPYTPGSVVRTSAQMHGCENPVGIDHTGIDWHTDDLAPAHWPRWSNARGNVDVPGELTITAPDEGVFTADMGGSVRFRRSNFSFGNCAIK